LFFESHIISGLVFRVNEKQDPGQYLLLFLKLLTIVVVVHVDRAFKVVEPGIKERGFLGKEGWIKLALFVCFCYLAI